jgi:AraC-like DNA-binding protein
MFHDEFLAMPEMTGVRSLLELSVPGLRFTGGAVARVVECLCELSAQPAGASRRLLLLIEALQHLAEARSFYALSKGIAPSGMQPRVQATLEWLQSHMDSPPRQAEVARRMGMSAPAFSRFFKRRLGKTYVQYLNEWRIGRACRALVESDEPITAIAFDAGFNNLSHFNRRFKALKGLTPGEFRKAFMPGRAQ